MENKDPKVAKILDRMRALCSRREYCTDDIRKKIILALPDSSDVVEVLVDALKKDRYVDDLRYAMAFARDKSSISGWGPMKIRYALGAKRIGSEVIDEALSCIDAGKASEKLEKILAGKSVSLKNDPDRRAKLIRFAIGRGYGYDEIMAVLSTLHPSP